MNLLILGSILRALSWLVSELPNESCLVNGSVDLDTVVDWLIVPNLFYRARHFGACRRSIIRRRAYLFEFSLHSESLALWSSRLIQAAKLSWYYFISRCRFLYVWSTGVLY